MPFVVCCALVYFWTLRFSRIGDFYTLRLGFFGNLDLRIIDKRNSYGTNVKHILHIDKHKRLFFTKKSYRKAMKPLNTSNMAWESSFKPII